MLLALVWVRAVVRTLLRRYTKLEWIQPSHRLSEFQNSEGKYVGIDINIFDAIVKLENIRYEMSYPGFEQPRMAHSDDTI